MSDTSNLSPAVAERLKIQYPALRVIRDGGDAVLGLDFNDLSAEEKHQITLDLEFFYQNPSLPLENLCSSLGTYEPRTPSQIELLEYAHKLAAFTDHSRGAGLFIWGDAGIGKSHISVGLSKLLMSKGMSPIFMTADSYSFNTVLPLELGQVWIIDDLNSGYGLASRLFKQVVLNIHDKGGRMFVTSNKSYDELLREMFVGEGEANRMRYDDRTRGLFKILHVTGNSYRQDTAWFK